MSEQRPKARPTKTPSSPSGSASLSSREIDMLVRISRGMTNQEIADELFLSPNSVKTYIRTAYAKIGVTTRARAVIWALRNGLGEGEWTPPGGDDERRCRKGL